MTTELLWKANELYSNIYQGFWKPIAVYNPKTHRLIYFKNVREYRIWTLVLLSSSGVNFGFYILFWFKIYKLILNDQRMPWFMIGSSFLGTICLTINFVSLCFVVSGTGKYVKLACLVLNQGAELEEVYMRVQPDSKSCMKTDYLGMSMYAIVAISALFPASYPLLESTSKFLVLDLMMGNIEHKIIAGFIIIFRKVFLCLMAFEADRIIFGLLLILIMCEEGSYFLINQYRLIGEKAIEKSNLRLLYYSVNSYNSVIILLSISEQIIALVIFAFMGGGLLASVTCNTLTVKMHPVTPRPYFYYWIPTVSIMILLVISFTLPQAVKIFDLSHRLVSSWKFKAGITTGINSRWIRRRMKAMRPINIPVGIGNFNLFFINKSVKTSYYQVLGDFTLNLMLGTPKFGNK